MAEYIEKATLLNRVIIPSICSCVQGPTAERLKKFCVDTVNNVSAADVAPVVHGSLKHTGTLWSSMWICTNCNEIAYYPPHGNRKKRIIQPCGYNYCPNCGAKMDEEAVK